jgi:hypothetical protein
MSTPVAPGEERTWGSKALLGSPSRRNDLEPYLLVDIQGQDLGSLQGAPESRLVAEPGRVAGSIH